VKRQDYKTTTVVVAEKTWTYEAAKLTHSLKKILY
jgi:hypothetical protein